MLCFPYLWSFFSSSCSVPVPPSTTPSWSATALMVPKKHLTSSQKLICSTYQPSSFAFSVISSSSRPWICAQPVRPGRTSFAPYLSRSANRSYWFQRAGRGPMTAISPTRIVHSWGSSSRLVLRRKRPTRVIYCSGSWSRWVGMSWGVSMRMVRNFRMLK